MKYAVLSGNGLFVDNIIVVKESQKAEMEAALNRKLIETTPWFLQIGDFYNGKTWTRNVDGEQVALPIEDDPAITEILDLIEFGGEA